MEKEIATRLSTLGHPQRLGLFRLLMRRYPDRVSAGELADALTLKPSTLSAYLNALLRAGLVTQERHATSLRYSINLTKVRGTFDYLLNDCCRGRSDICVPAPTLTGGLDMADRKYNVLFICVGNSARSIFAETILREIAGDRFNAYSAGTRPFSELNPFALEVLKSKGHDVADLRAKNVSEFTAPDAPVMDFVFTVCDRAANEECPAWDGQPVTAHWGTPDPVRAEGTEAEKALAFQHAYGALRNRIMIFAALPFDSLDKVSLQARVDDIGRKADEAEA
ncbi:arsenate reductase/protein-tyrosine-phosphatase family protein [Roseovarius nitratireducens]|uniref:arsenate reductase/protein-tyrosine-phosphatase family protein n=1 Tax=Roseovarius nitratireducens TaxID=2044597 RepID=UPI000CE1C9AB|nr:helix-turn-helix domain-containing protein [Roseovarius nitratireducens]